MIPVSIRLVWKYWRNYFSPSFLPKFKEDCFFLTSSQSIFFALGMFTCTVIGNIYISSRNYSSCWKHFLWCAWEKSFILGKDFLSTWVSCHERTVYFPFLFYVQGFHLTVATDAMLELGKHASSNNKIFATNLSAPFLCQFFAEQQMSVMPYVDYLFGNETVS